LQALSYRHRFSAAQNNWYQGAPVVPQQLVLELKVVEKGDMSKIEIYARKFEVEKFNDKENFDLRQKRVRRWCNKVFTRP